MTGTHDAPAARVLVLWADDRSANLGVRALAQGAGRLATRAFGEHVTVTYQDYRRNPDGFAPTVPMIKRDVLRSSGPIKQWLRDFDLIIDTGAGDSFADIYGWRRAFLMMYVQLTGSRLGIPVVLAPQTIGPFRTRRMRAMARLALRRAALVSPRDSTSARYARSLGRKQVQPSTDVVFVLPRPEPTAERDVVLNVSGLLWNTADHGDSTRYRASVVALIEGLQQRGRRVTLLAHVLENSSIDDDVPVVRELAARFGIEAVVPTDLDEVRRTVAGARLVVGARMHACLNAISTGTPAIAWAYSRKFAPLLSDIGWPYTVDLHDDDDPAATTLDLVDSRSDAELHSEVEALLRRTDDRIEPVISALRGLLPQAARSPETVAR
jgi:colanic acid/amylovoran biosynthesis protein